MLIERKQELHEDEINLVAPAIFLTIEDISSKLTLKKVYKVRSSL
jgi:hypothetical protein